MNEEQGIHERIKQLDDDELLSIYGSVWHAVEEFRRRMELEVAENTAQDANLYRIEILKRMARSR